CARQGYYDYLYYFDYW
nr:immunoglobulin heavy chain junction region [Mus musculus]MBK4186798.1 immunoglobulin heavy chain junction region [Mus musculus]